MRFKEIFLLAISLIYFSAFSQTLDYTAFIQKINQLIHEEKLTEAKSFIESNIDLYSEHWFDISKELISTNEKLNKHEENLEIFIKAHQKGYFYLIHPQIQSYKAYLNFNEFDTISKADLKLRNEANNNSETIYEVYTPDNYSSKKKYPLIFLFHGGGKNIEDVKKHWQSELLNTKFIKVYVQSYRHYDFNTYGWGTSNNRIDTDIRKIYRKLINDYHIDTNSILIGGISAGATSAIDLTLRSVIPTKGFITYCPSTPSILKDKKFDQIKNSSSKGYIVAGEKDFFLPQQKQMIHLFDSLGYKYKYTILKNMGHEYPKKEPQQIKEGINYILGIKH